MGGWQKQCLFFILLSSFLVLAVNGAPDISQAVVKADNEDKQDAIMLADVDDQEDPDDEQLDMQQDDDEPDDNDVEELDYDATDGDDDENNAVQQDDDDDDALTSGRRCYMKRICRWIRIRWRRRYKCTKRRVCGRIRRKPHRRRPRFHAVRKCFSHRYPCRVVCRRYRKCRISNCRKTVCHNIKIWRYY